MTAGCFPTNARQNDLITLSTRPLGVADLGCFHDHFERHRAESGRDGDQHFMPFDPDDEDGPAGLVASALDLGRVA